jgi:hypothetical protein
MDIVFNRRQPGRKTPARRPFDLGSGRLQSLDQTQVLAAVVIVQAQALAQLV